MNGQSIPQIGSRWESPETGNVFQVVQHNLEAPENYGIGNGRYTSLCVGVHRIAGRKAWDSGLTYFWPIEAFATLVDVSNSHPAKQFVTMAESAVQS